VRIRLAVAIAAALTTALSVAGGAPVAAGGSALSGPVSVSMTAPTTAVYGSWMDYTITVTHADVLTGESTDFTLTDALPPEVIFITSSITDGTCTRPAVGTNGTVACTFRFAPRTLTTTIKITVEVEQKGTVSNTAELSTGDTESATTTITTLPPGSIAVTDTGPDTITIPLEAAPQRFGWAIGIAYTGPPLTGRVRARFTIELPSQVKNPGMEDVQNRQLANCVFPSSGTPGGEVSCDVNFDPSVLSTGFSLTVRPTGAVGTGINTLTLDTGDSASATTTFVSEPPPPVPGPPAAAPQTAVETFTAPGQKEPEAATITPSAKTAQVVATWTDPNASLDLTSFQLVSNGKVVASGRRLSAADRKKPTRLKITKKRRSLSVEARVTNLRRGRLRFKVVARKLPEATKVRVTVRQSKKRSSR
jgi:hypothetical protein